MNSTLVRKDIAVGSTFRISVTDADYPTFPGYRARNIHRTGMTHLIQAKTPHSAPAWAVHTEKRRPGEFGRLAVGMAGGTTRFYSGGSRWSCARTIPIGRVCST